MVKIANKLTAKKSYSQKAYLGRFPYNLVQSGNLEKYYNLLTNFQFIAEKINHPEFGVDTLIDDYDLIDEVELLTHPEYDAQTVKALKLIQGALRLSAHILIEDTKQLAGQLSGRLLYFDAPEIQGLLQQIPRSKTTCLRSLTGSLTTPNEPLIRTLTGHSGSVWSVTVTPDGEQVISGSQDGTIKIWNLNSGNLICTISAHDDSVHTIATTADGLYVISGSHDTTIKIWNLKTGQLVRTLRGHFGSVNTVILTPDGSKIISASSDSSLKIWNIKTGEVLHTLIGHTRSVQAVTIVFSKNNKWVISGSYDKTIKVWNLETGKEELALNDSHWVGCITATPDGKRVISALEDGTLTVWKVGTWEKEYILKGHSNSVRTVAVTPDGKRIISGSSNDGTLKIWKVETWENEATFTGHTAWVLAVAVTPNAKQIISASGNHIFSSEFTIKVWSLEKCIEAFSLKAERNTITAHSDSVEVVAFTPDGEYVISAAKDDNFKLWKVGTWENEASFTGESKSALALGDYAVITGYVDLIFEQNESALTLVGDYNNNYKVFELKAGDVKCTLHSISNTLPFLLATTADGKRQIWAYGDETLKVWDVSARQFIASFTGESEIRCCAIAPDGVTIVAGEASGRLHFLRLEGIEV